MGVRALTAADLDGPPVRPRLPQWSRPIYSRSGRYDWATGIHGVREDMQRLAREHYREQDAAWRARWGWVTQVPEPQQ